MARAREAVRRPLISGNWKMHQDHFEAIHTIRDLGLRLKPDDTARVDVSVHPPFTDLRSAQTVLEAEDIPVHLGAQDVHWEDKGAFTGEISPVMLAKLNVGYVIVGHSERRQLFGETDETVVVKLGAVLRHAMTPICCVGETEAEHDAGLTRERLDSQVRAALGKLSPEQVAGMVLAYEPIWAIGTGKAATAEDAQGACAFIREVVGELAGGAASAAIRIQYGGSVKAENAEELVSQADVDGLLVGGASLDAASFVGVVRSAGSAP